MGVFGVIVPYNFSSMVPWWFLPYAVVCGNTFIVKPSEKVPMTQSRIFEIVDNVDFPDGVVNMVHGTHDVVNAMLDHPDIVGISFVSSTPTAKYIYERCGVSSKRVQALGGAKNIIAVMPDANIDKGIPSLITSFFGCTGQRCLSGSILAAVGDIADVLIEKFVSAAKSIKVGNGLDEQTTMGPVVSAAHKERILGYIEQGIKDGADLILDGRNFTVKNYPNGFFIGPTIFDNVTHDMTIATEEIFGPVISIMRAKNLDEVIDIVNSRNYANAALYLYTKRSKSQRI
eukprot:CAMPEP_0201285972 /NCGR_PEP_ID=MMETSP1317-20130820/114095_1 /ASSEMBLY_ACC=CAM_ASM_000770 /TAXON_ID=187299 /ORGANISM="Undescribed Undescribed, Strain Undescribed" /LENGTH=286 /DNA_ID=CAMNT_0047612277 /DNA_START=656 /DNA_END=1515 /DNA_ORIENTATION=+